MAESVIAAGFRVIWYGTRDSSGIFIGGTATAPTAGAAAGSGMIRLNGARTIPITIPDPVIVPVTGDDEPEVSFEFDSESLPNGVLEMSVRDNTFEALVQGTKVQTVGDLDISVIDPKGRSSVDMCFLLSRVAKSWKPGERGAKKWENLWIGSATVKPLYASVEQRTFSPYRYSLNVSRADRVGWTTVNETEHGTTAASIFPIDSDNPLHLKRFTGNNSQQTFTLDYAPVSAAKTYVYVNDLRQTVTTDYSISGTSLIFVVAPTSNAVVSVLSEVSESNLL